MKNKSNGNWVIKKDQLIIEKDFEEDTFVKDNVCKSPWNDQLDKINSILVNEGVTILPAGSFYNCTNVKEISLPDTLKTIGYQCFHNCSSLEQLIIPKNVCTIGDYAFTFCISLKKIIIKAKMPLLLGKNLFETSADSHNIITLECNCNVFEYIAESNIGSNGCITQDCIEKKDDWEWELTGGCLTIKQLSDSIIFVKENKCYSPWNKYRLGIHSALVSEGILRLPPGIFYDCTQVKEIELPTSLKVIGYQAFHNCRLLETLILPGNIEHIEPYCFTYCTSLKTLFFMGIKAPTLGFSLFEHSGTDKCITLKGRNWVNSNIFTQDVVGIDAKVSYTAYGRSSALEWTLENGELVINTVGKTHQLMPDYVQDNHPSSPWYPYRNGIYTISILGKFKCLGAGAFYDCINVETISINPEVETIHHQCFHNCQKIQKLHFPQSTHMIGDYAFTYCFNLNTILFLSEKPIHLGKLLFEGIPQEHKIQIFAINLNDDFLDNQSNKDQIQITQIG